MDAIVSQYRKPLMAFFRRHSQNYWDAEDLVQEVFCKIIKHNDIDEDSNQEAYLFTVARNVLRDKARSDQARKRDKHQEFDEDFLSPADTPLEQTIDSQQQYRQFLETLEQLPPLTRRIFLLHRYDQATYWDIAAYYGISASLVEKHISQALATLRKLLDRTEERDQH